MPKEQEIYLIRHLPTIMNISGAYMGRDFDPGITETEVNSFLDKLDYLKPKLDLSNPLIYTSPAKRCKQTLEIAMNHLGMSNVDVKIEEDLQETDFGKASGLTVSQIKDKFPKVYESWITDPSKTSFPDGESYKDVQERSWMILQRGINELKNFSSLIICTHVDVMKMLLFKVTNTPISSKPLVIIPNGGICTLVCNGDKLKFKALC